MSREAKPAPQTPHPQSRTAAPRGINPPTQDQRRRPMRNQISYQHQLNRREFVGITSVAGLELLAGAYWVEAKPLDSSTDAKETSPLKLLPYPQEVKLTSGSLRLGRAICDTTHELSPTAALAFQSLNRHLPQSGRKISLRLGCVEEGYDSTWLTPEENHFLASAATGPETSIVTITPKAVTVVGKGKWGMLYGVQTVNQLLIQAQREKRTAIPCLSIRDWPDLKWRCLAPTLTWYSGWGRLEGYDICNWTEAEWKWLADWSLLHKYNAWAVCMYGYWPFTLPGYEQETLDVDSFFYNPQTGKKEQRRFTHKNIQKEFFPEVIRYANARGIKVHAYIGKNSFNGRHFKNNPAIYAGGAAELIPFAPGVEKYWDTFLGRILSLGFDGFVFEDPEAKHVPNQNAQCYETFWKPWAATYGFSSVKETDQNKPPLGVHIEYYTWLFKTFDRLIQQHAQRLSRKPEIYLISHVLLLRIMTEAKTEAERREWFDLVDQKHGRKMPFIIHESNEAAYVKLLGKDRVASLGGRGGSCTAAMRRIGTVNNNWLHRGFGADLAHERACQQRLVAAGGFGAMGYVFEWTNTEVFGYLAAQYLWRSDGIPGVSNTDQVGILDYAYRLYYGDEVGNLVARALDGASHANDAMVFEDIHAWIYPGTGKTLYRDYQLLAALADHAEQLARQAYRLFTGKDPQLFQTHYDQEKFLWDGYDPARDKTFKTERLRLLWVSMRRSQEICNAALAHRLAQRLIAQGAAVGDVLEQMERAIGFAKASQLIYQRNYDDDYDPVDGLCVKVTDRLESLRARFLMDVTGEKSVRTLKSWDFMRDGSLQGWTRFSALRPPVIEDGMLVTEATGNDPWMIQTQPLLIPAGSQPVLVSIEMASNRPGKAEVFWSTSKSDDPRNSPVSFIQNQSALFEVAADKTARRYRVPIKWDDQLNGLRLDIPDKARVEIRSIRIEELLPRAEMPKSELRTPVPEPVRKTAEAPILFIPWEKQTNILPAIQIAKKPALYLSTYIGFVATEDYFRLGVVFTIQARIRDHDWQIIFREALQRRSCGWQHRDIPLDDSLANGEGLRLRFITDSYSRAQNRIAPTWKWALWGQPQLFRVQRRKPEVWFDFIERLGDATAFVRLDRDGKDRVFDRRGEDSTGATFHRVDETHQIEIPKPIKPTIAAFTPHKDGQFGLTIAEYEIRQ